MCCTELNPGPWRVSAVLGEGGIIASLFLYVVLFLSKKESDFLTQIELVTKTSEVFIHMWPFSWLSHFTNVLISSFFPIAVSALTTLSYPN